jgi:hypothetical protein
MHDQSFVDQLVICEKILLNTLIAMIENIDAFDDMDKLPDFTCSSLMMIAQAFENRSDYL